MTVYKYKSKKGNDFMIPGVGESTNGVIESPIKIENPSLELVSNSEMPTEQAVTSTAPVAAPGAVIGVAPQATAQAPQHDIQPPVVPINIQEQN